MKIQEAYQIIKQDLTPRLGEREASNIAAILLEDLFSIKQLWRDRSLLPEQSEEFESARRSLLDGIPIQYVTGKAHFYGMDLIVNQNVLIPRPETEELVYQVLKWCDKKPYRVLDIGTGSGCIALALKKEAPWLDISGVDVSKAALDVAGKNASNLGLDVRWVEGDILDDQTWKELPDFNVIVSNPPYIPISEWDVMDSYVRDHEPRKALFTDDLNGMQFYQRIAEKSLDKLKPGGHIFLECNALRAQTIEDLFRTKNYLTRLIKDLQGMDRILEAWL